MASPIHTVGALLVRTPGEVLLGMRANLKKKWPGHGDAIGGHVEANEAFKVALMREVHEEIGVTVLSHRLLQTIPGDGDYLHHIYAVTAWSGEPQNLSDEHDEIRWFVSLTLMAFCPRVGWPAFSRCALPVRHPVPGSAELLSQVPTERPL